jgi:6-pyruvoyltetrahydropterin/6-carboxytetrahydropterin synthase
MFELGIVGEFEAAHSLRPEFGPAARLHGHTYRVEIKVRARETGPDGTFCDAGILKAALGSVLGGLHYRNLNDIEALAGVNTTVEMVAKHIFKEVELAIADGIPAGGLQGMKVTVWESPSVFASYSEAWA